MENRGGIVARATRRAEENHRAVKPQAPAADYEVAAHTNSFTELHSELTRKYQDLLARVAGLPDKLAPAPADLEAAQAKQAEAAAPTDNDEPAEFGEQSPTAQPVEQDAAPTAAGQGDEPASESEELPL